METFSVLLALSAGNSPVPVNSPHKGQWCGALMLSLICAWINGWVNNREAGDLWRHRPHYDVIVMQGSNPSLIKPPLNLNCNSVKLEFTSFCHRDITLITAWVSNHIHYKVRDEITNPFPNLNVTVEVWEWIINFIRCYIMEVITYPWRY